MKGQAVQHVLADSGTRSGSSERDEWVTIPGALRALKDTRSGAKSRQALLAAALRGELTARVIAGRVLIERASLRSYHERTA